MNAAGNVSHKNPETACHLIHSQRKVGNLILGCRFHRFTAEIAAGNRLCALQDLFVAGNVGD